ncbi:alpha/beta fold hydrolase [Streptomyces sp. NPDC048473]|uniref:alpha/beta fold hydrolase n=1 Tax=unclassified Streptomyces TaxID=2593676 RepID=UPI00371444AB
MTGLSSPAGPALISDQHQPAGTAGEIMCRYVLDTETIRTRGEGMKFVLVHGGWQGGWTWDELSSVLGSRGHEVFAPTLRGLEEHNADRAGLALTDMANGLVRDIEERDLRDFVLVGHSGGGPVAQYIADRLPERVRRTVFISAWVLRDGESINDVRPAQSVEEARAQAERSGDCTVPMDPDTWASRFMQDATPERLATATARLVPSPFGWFDQRIDLPRFFDLQLPASYIFLRQDLSAPKEHYEMAAARLNNPLVTECDGSHQAMQTRPNAVADALLSVIPEHSDGIAKESA